MKESHPENKREQNAAPSERSDQDLAAQVFVQLNSARKIGEFCSSDHPQCLRAAERAVKLVHGAPDSPLEVSFASGDGSITAGGKRFEPGEPYLADFAAALRAAGITVVRLSGGVSPDGLVRFTRLLAASTDADVGTDQFHQFLSGPVAGGIRVGMASAAGRPAARPVRGSTGVSEDVWKGEVRRLLGAATTEKESARVTGDNSEGGTRASGVVLTDIAPQQLARYINSLDFDDNVELISGHFLRPYLDRASSDVAGDEIVVPLQVRARFLQLLRSLSPGHQVSFITAVLEMSHRFTEFADTVLEAVPIHLAAQSFDGIRTEENTVHPQIVSRYEALCRLTGWSAPRTRAVVEEKGEERIEVDNGEGILFGAPSPESPPEKRGPVPGSLLLKEQVRSAIALEFAATGKRKALVRVLLDLLERSTSLDETRAYCGTLPGLFSEALEEKDWTGLYRDWFELTGLVEQGRQAKPFLGKALERTRKSFLTIQAMDQIVGGIESSTPEACAVIQQWLPLLGKAEGESLVLALIASNNRTQRHNLLSCIVAFGEDAIGMALKRINDHRWYVVRNMISIIREVGEKKAGEDLLPLAGHVQFQVRRELVNTLLSLEHPEGLVLAEKGLRGNDQKMRSACIGLLGSHRVDGARSILLRILEDKYRGGVPFNQAQKVSAAWALGQIGNSSVLPALHDLLRKKRLIKSPGTHELKMAILRSLPGYPLGEAKPLAQWGASHGDEDEAIICRRLLHEINALPEEKGE